jgi:hypothetical protein
MIERSRQLKVFSERVIHHTYLIRIDYLQPTCYPFLLKVRNGDDTFCLTDRCRNYVFAIYPTQLLIEAEKMATLLFFSRKMISCRVMIVGALQTKELY